MKASIAILALALAACSTPSDIVKTGNNAYRVRTTAGGGSPSDAEIKTRGIVRANEFCDAQGQRAVINVGQSSGWHAFSVQTAEVQFFCDDKLPTRAVMKLAPEASALSASAAASAPAMPSLPMTVAASAPASTPR